MVKFSIIIPIYNVEKYLSACIDSILNQTYTNYEVILVDDGSNDKSPQICDNYAKKDSRISVIHKSNGGQSDARNVGLRSASGEYVFFVDSDDFLYTKEALSKIADKTKDSPDVVFHKRIKWFEKTGRYSDCDYKFEEDYKSQPYEKVLCDLIDKGAYGNAAWNKVVRRTLLVDNGIEFKTGISAEDNDWFYQILTVMQSVRLIDEVIYVYRQRMGSVTHSKSEHLFDNMMWIIEKWSNAIQESPSERWAKVISSDLAYQYCNTIINYCNTNKTHAAFKRLKRYDTLLSYGNHPRVKLFRKIKAIVGLRGLILLISIANRIREL